ncbi:hypothetical protein GCM10010269_10710 [Streptomyces humidus]|uniref:Uncharacterized protein n=1 Tax=Streptomyces humidus TaxID=52259 RepID=A0A918FRQ4_9ACTN|nr:hypothetical protein GCM10010269_10710 [Streptomyces humidus]
MEPTEVCGGPAAGRAKEGGRAEPAGGGTGLPVAGGRVPAGSPDGDPGTAPDGVATRWTPRGVAGPLPPEGGAAGEEAAEEGEGEGEEGDAGEGEAREP